MEQFKDYLYTYQLTCKYLVADSAFMTPDWEKLYNALNIQPKAIGPNTPWPNRAEASMKTFKHHGILLIDSVRCCKTTEPPLKQVTVNHVFKKAAWARKY